MSINFLNTVKNYVASDLPTQAADSLGEAASGISKALSALIPAGLGAVLSKATAGNDDANTVFGMAKNTMKDTSSSLPGFNELKRGNDDLVSRFFGSKQSLVSDAVSQFAGIKNSSVSPLSGVVLTIILGLLGKHAQQNNLSASGLSGFLSSQKDNILQGMPAGLSSFGELLGLGISGAASAQTSPMAETSAANKTVNVVDEKPEVIAAPSAGNKWLWPLIFILAAIALFWYLKATGKL